MKLTKKKVLAIAMAICLIATISVGTLAWFTDDDSVTNDFLIAGSENKNPDEVFSVDVWEKDAPNSNDKLDRIEFDEILPGDDLYKEVNIENTGSYDQYIRVTVTVTGAEVWQEIFDDTFFALDKLVAELNADFAKPERVVYDGDNDALSYVLYYKKVLAVDEVVTLFTNVVIPAELDRDQAANLQDFQIKVVADAVQTENVGDTACKAFTTVGMHDEEGYFYYAETPAGLEKVLEVMPEVPGLAGIVFTEENVELNMEGFENPLTTDFIRVEPGTTLEVTGGVMNVGTDGDYANIIQGTAVYDDVEINAVGGGIGVVNGAKVEFNSGSVIVKGSTTNPRYNFYVVGGSELEINGGEFDFTSKTLKRAYIYADAGSTVTINGGEFGKASTRSGYTAGIMGNGTVIINGGTFGFDPSAWLGDGHTATYDSATQTWTVA